ncbi:hypothetical protein Tco_1052434, partial [Tanacetum coccineum]
MEDGFCDDKDVKEIRVGPDNLDNLRKLFEKQAPGTGEGASGMSTIHMDDNEVPKLVVHDRRKDYSKPAEVSNNGPSIPATPFIRRISLRMSMDSIVRVAQQGQQGQKLGGRRGTGPMQQNQQPTPMMQQQ